MIRNLGFLGQPQGYPFNDADAKAFSDAAGLTDDIHKEAVDDLVAGLKTDSLWSKFSAIYPMVGGTATTHKYNLIDPQDTDGAFRLTWYGGWTHSSTGALPNGSTGYAETHLTPATTLGDTTLSIGYYSRTDSKLFGEFVMGAHQGSWRCLLTIWNTFSQANLELTSDSGGTTYWIATKVTNLSGDGYWIGSQDGTDLTLRKDKTEIVKNTSTSILRQPNSTTVFIGAKNTSGFDSGNTNKQCAFAHLGEDMTITESNLFYDRVQTFQTDLSREI